MAKDNFESRVFDLLTDGIKSLQKNQDRLDRKLDRNTERLQNLVSDNTRKTEKGFEILGNRVGLLEDERAKKLADLQPWYRDPVLIKTVVLVIIGVIAAWLGVKLPQVL